LKTIVVGYDETEPAKRALTRAAELAQAFGSRIVVTSVAPVLAASARGGGAIDPADPLEKHTEELKHAQAFLAERGLNADLQPAVGDPAATIVEVAESESADLIVVGTREPGILERLLGTSVSAGVSRRAHCDVLIVH
jgi:nucleotide-binding universal stress UspA family protein